MTLEESTRLVRKIYFSVLMDEGAPEDAKATLELLWQKKSNKADIELEAIGYEQAEQYIEDLLGESLYSKLVTYASKLPFTIEDNSELQLCYTDSDNNEQIVSYRTACSLGIPSSDLSWVKRPEGSELYKSLVRYKDTTLVDSDHGPMAQTLLSWDSATLENNIIPHPPMDDADLLLLLTSQRYRLTTGVYKVRKKSGDIMPFVMNPQQTILYNTLEREPRVILLKSRQTGASTMMLILSLDDVTTKDYFEAGLQAQKEDTAKSLMSRVKLAWDHIPNKYKEALALKKATDNTGEIGFSNGSVLQASTGLRGGTLNSLHISEVSYIAAEYPEKMVELLTGTLQAIAAGMRVVLESTARGMDNWFHEQWYRSVELLKEKGHTGLKGYYPLFLSCWDDPDCRVHYEVNKEKLVARLEKQSTSVIKYLDSALDRFEEELGRTIDISPEQVEWWLEQFEDLGSDWDMMLQEYPDVPSAAFSSGKDGTYYSRLIREQVEQKGQINPDVYDEALDLFAAMDLGMNDSLVTIVFGLDGDQMRVVDSYANSGESLLHYVKWLKDNYRQCTTLFMPHDANVRELSSKISRAQFMRSEGYRVYVLPKTESVVNDIEIVRQRIANVWFQEGKTKELVSYLKKYRKEFDEKRQVFKDQPVHDEASHYADAFRYAILGAIKFRQWGRRKSARRKSNVVDGLAIPGI